MHSGHRWHGVLHTRQLGQQVIPRFAPRLPCKSPSSPEGGTPTTSCLTPPRGSDVCPDKLLSVVLRLGLPLSPPGDRPLVVANLLSVSRDLTCWDSPHLRLYSRRPSGPGFFPLASAFKGHPRCGMAGAPPWTAERSARVWTAPQGLCLPPLPRRPTQPVALGKPQESMSFRASSCQAHPRTHTRAGLLPGPAEG